MRHLFNLSRGQLLATGAILTVLFCTAITWWQVTPRPGRLPTAAELQEPFAKPGPGGTAGLLSQEQGQALEQGKTVTINVPGGGTFVLSPSRKAPSDAPPNSRK